MVPGDDARQRYCVEIADSCANSSRGVDNVAVLKAGVVRRKSILDVESHPVGLGWPTVDEQHDAESDSIDDGECNCKPNAPIPLPGVRACHEATVEEQDRHLGTSTADQE